MRLAGEDAWQSFGEAFGTHSNSKFSNIRLHRGDTIMLRSPGGGGYGPPAERDAALVAEDVREGVVSRERARELYAVAIDGAGEVDEAATAELRAAAGTEPS